MLFIWPLYLNFRMLVKICGSVSDQERISGDNIVVGKSRSRRQKESSDRLCRLAHLFHKHRHIHDVLVPLRKRTLPVS